MGNPFVHVELNTQDLDKAKKFYGDMFDWHIEDIPNMDYTMINVGNGVGGGMMKHPVPNAPSFWLSYVEVADIHQATEKARGLGAHIVRDVMEVPNTGWLSIFTDPTGATLGLWQPMQPGK